MSVNLEPSSQLAFQKPFTQLVKQYLRVTNPHGQPIAFKVKTTAPKQYCVRPNSGKIEPGESVEVQVLLQPMKEDPPLTVKCKDKFLVQSTFITPARESNDLQDLWTAVPGDESSKVHQQKLKVVYLPADGVLPEEDEPEANQSSLYTQDGDSRFDTVRQYDTHRPNANGHHLENPGIPIFDRSSTPPPVAPPPALAHKEYYAEPQTTTTGHVAPLAARPLPSLNKDHDVEHAIVLHQAHAEIARLKELLASRDQELRRRKPFTDDGASVAETEGGASVVEQHVQPEGVPLNVVALLSICVFLITYLWF